jgi:hypothetical protein
MHIEFITGRQILATEVSGVWTYYELSGMKHVKGSSEVLNGYLYFLGYKTSYDAYFLSYISETSLTSSRDLTIASVTLTNTSGSTSFTVTNPFTASLTVSTQALVVRTNSPNITGNAITAQSYSFVTPNLASTTHTFALYNESVVTFTVQAGCTSQDASSLVKYTLQTPSLWMTLFPTTSNVNIQIVGNRVTLGDYSSLTHSNSLTMTLDGTSYLTPFTVNLFYCESLCTTCQ